MPMHRDCYPLVVHLLDGRRAEYVAGTRPAKYAIDGELSDIDVTIPDDLAESGWYWFGSFVSDGQVGIFTGTYGIPGVFDQAHIHIQLRVGYEPPPVQLELFKMAA